MDRRLRTAQAVLDAGGRFVDFDQHDMAPFWNCVMGAEVDVGMFSNIDQIQQRIESAYFLNPQTFGRRLKSDCVPRLTAARVVGRRLLGDMPDVLKTPLEKYLAALPRMQEGLAHYAETLKSRKATKDVDTSIQEVGAAFTTEPTAQSVAFEKFMVCAIPDLSEKADIQTVLEFLAATCKQDAVGFMSRVRAECGKLVQNIPKRAKPSETFEVNAEKFYEEDRRQLQAWDWCGKRSRKGQKLRELEAFLTATGDYMEARGDVAWTARDEAARITGQPRPAARRTKAGEADEAAARGSAAKPAK
jgi:hypothetical protein